MEKNNTTDEIESILKDVTKTLVTAAEKVLQNGYCMRPRIYNNEFFNAYLYKSAKRDFRNLLLKKSFDYERNENNIMDNLFDNDRGCFQRITL